MVSDPWANTLDGDFFDDSLQDTDFYSNMKMYSSMADLDNLSEDDILEGLHITHYKNVCFSMEDIFASQSNGYIKNLINHGDKPRDSATKEQRSITNSKDPTENVPKRPLPTNIVKPTVRQSYPEMVNLNPKPPKAPTKKTFAYRVSKI